MQVSGINSKKQLCQFVMPNKLFEILNLCFQFRKKSLRLKIKPKISDKINYNFKIFLK